MCPRTICREQGRSHTIPSFEVEVYVFRSTTWISDKLDAVVGFVAMRRYDAAT
jgi:hypothetical protein